MSEVTDWNADWLAKLPVKIRNLLRAFNKISSHMFDCKDCGVGRFVAGACNANGFAAAGCGNTWFVFAAISWKSRLIIC